MARTDITQNKQWKDVQKIEGLISCEIGETNRGKQCIIVALEKEFEDNRELIPKKIDGYPVLVEIIK